MDALLFAAAVAALLGGGFGVVALVTRGRRVISLGELVALSAAFGVFVATLVWWVAALVARSSAPAAVTAVCAALAAWGIHRWRRERPEVVGRRIFCLAALPLIAAVGWLAATTPFQWDGLFVWEMKARAVQVEGGVPLDYLRDDSRGWSHPIYPLLVPLLRVWTQGWLEAPHEGFGKLVEVLFFVVAVGLLASLGSRVGAVAGATALALLALTPRLLVLDGSATSGYADFAVFVFYGGAVQFLAYALWREEPGDLAIAGLLAAALPWTKQEGTLLLAVFVGLALLTLGQRAWRNLHQLAAPGILVAASWAAFVRLAHVQSAVVFDPPSLEGLRERLHLSGEIGRACLDLALAPQAWGLFWPLFLFALVIAPRALSRRLPVLCCLAVVVPACLYGATYLFTRWRPVTLHVESSFTRLMLQLALPAILLIAWKTEVLFVRGNLSLGNTVFGRGRSGRTEKV